MAKVQPGPRKGRPVAEADTPPGAWRGRLRLWIDIKGRGSLGPGKLRLLEEIARTRSLSAAAKQLDMSYRLAWQHLRLIEERTGLAVVEPHRGGRDGGGTDLTAAGEALLQAYRIFRNDVEDHAQATFCRHFADGTGLRVPERQRAKAWLRRPVFAGVLVGGASTRMGRSKSLLRLEGMTFAERVVAAVRERVERIVLLGDGPAPSMPPDVVRLPDVPGLGGPLAGILAGLRWAGEVCWLVVACDLPILRAEAVDWLLGQRRPGRWAVLPKITPSRVEPLAALYEPESRMLLEKLVARGCHAPRQLEGDPAVYTPTPPPSLRECWANVNTPEELERLGANRSEPPRGSGR